jgi:ferritin-like metal-binding protein YciE
MIENAESPDLRTALAQHLEETRGHVARLEQVFEMHGEEARKQKCKGMQGVLAEGDEMVGKDATPAVRDAAIISSCQRVEHYEISAYGTVRTYAEQMGHQRAAAILKQTLDEELAADKKLTQIAKSRNIQAARTA